MALYDILKEVNTSDYVNVFNNFMTYKTRAARTPYLAYYELTPLCTLNCKFCYSHLQKSEQEKRGEILRLAEWSRLADETINMGVKRIILTGGECLLHPDFFEIYKYIYNKNIEISIISNGTLIDETAVEFFCKYPPNAITISIYGYSEETYLKACGNATAYNNVMHAIELLKSSNISFQLVTTVSEDNKDDIQALLKYAEENKLRYMFSNMLKANRECTLDTILAYGTEDGEIDNVRRNIIEKRGGKIKVIPDYEIPRDLVIKKKGINCGAGVNIFHINWLGEMQPCPTFNAKKIKTNDKKLSVAWQELTNWAKNIPQLIECQTCKHQYRCSLCLAAHWGDTGSFGKVSPRLCYKVQHGITD